MDKIARKIKTYIKATGRTQTYLCKHTGLSNAAMSLTLGGKRRLRLEEYCAICKALELESDFFL